MKLLKVIAIVAVITLAAACGGNETATNDASSPLAEGDYCKAARDWAVQDLDPRHDEDPAWLESWWGEYLAFVATAEQTAPQSIDGAWSTYRGQVDAQDALFEKYEFDQAAFEAEATPAEQSVFEEPEPAVQAAFDEILAFEALTCDAGEPTPADVRGGSGVRRVGP